MRNGAEMNTIEGWKLVPVELTPDMKHAAHNKIDLALRVGLPEYDLTDGVEMAWDAALAAAPAAPEVEPVATINRVEMFGKVHITVDLNSKGETLADETPLYTSSPSELVKAAEELLLHLYDAPTGQPGHEYVKALRTALDTES